MPMGKCAWWTISATQKQEAYTLLTVPPIALSEANSACIKRKVD